MGKDPLEVQPIDEIFLPENPFIIGLRVGPGMIPMTFPVGPGGSPALPLFDSEAEALGAIRHAGGHGMQVGQVTKAMVMAHSKREGISVLYATDMTKDPRPEGADGK